MNYAQKLADIRVLRGLSQNEMADILGIGQVVYSQIERGYTKNPKAFIIENAKKHFGYDIFDEKEELNILKEPSVNYFAQRQANKLKDKTTIVPFYNVAAHAGSADIEPYNASKSVAGISTADLFKDSQYVVQIGGNSMLPNYPSGGIIGIAKVEYIRPGEVYVVESKDGQLWIKRLFYKNDDADTNIYQLVSDNTIRHDSGSREGKLCYPDFFIDIEKVKCIFEIKINCKSNSLTFIN